MDALLHLIRSHQCEEASGGLLENLFNNVRIREMKISKYAIAPLSQYLLDPHTRSQSGKLLAALALGNLSQHERHARANDSVSACRALISLLEDQPTEEMTMVAICALQNFVMNSRTNRRAVAEAGGILVIQELLLFPNTEVARQAALLIKFLFSTHTLQEYVSNELIRSLTGTLLLSLLTVTTALYLCALLATSFGMCPCYKTLPIVLYNGKEVKELYLKGSSIFLFDPIWLDCQNLNCCLELWFSFYFVFRLFGTTKAANFGHLDGS
jgi:hypothetical protein